ncbi:24-hydroxycholesterol 7-alpha-hydroxylase, partial [Galemys pyrenaicus]
DYTVPSGDLLMLSPFWLHRNPKYFPEPESFNPERWKKANLEKHAFLDGFMAFGNGKYQCPGRSVKQLGHIYPESLQRDDVSEGKKLLLNPFLFIIKLWGNLETTILWFALLEIQIFIILIFYKYDCRLLDPLPKQ